MKATELHLKDGRSAGIYFCGQCRIVHRSQDSAERCCETKKCEDCKVADVEPYRSCCSACSSLREIRRERERFEGAEKISIGDYVGEMVFCEGFGRGGYCEPSELLDYISDLEDEIKEHGEADKQIPEYAWACTPSSFVYVDIDDIKDQIANSGDCYEDFDPDDLSGLDELAKALDAFNSANTGVLSYSPDYKKAVLINSISAGGAGSIPSRSETEV